MEKLSTIVPNYFSKKSNSFHTIFLIYTSRPPAPNHVRGSWASLENAENAEKDNFFNESGDADSLKAFSAKAKQDFQILGFAKGMRFMENRYLPDSPETYIFFNCLCISASSV